MPFAASLSTAANTRTAVADVCRDVSAQLAGAPVSLAFAFVSLHHAAEMQSIAAAMCGALATHNLLGCTGESIIGNAREIEAEPAISLWAASNPSMHAATFALDFQQNHEGGAFSGWPDDLPDTWHSDATLLLLAEPFTFPADELLRRLNEDRPGVPVLGGMASGGQAPGENQIILGREVLQRGAVAALIHGTTIRSVVSQGCRPIGKPFVVTRAERNIILELGGVPPLARLNDLYPSLTAAQKQQVRHGLHVGVVRSEYQDSFSPGDFLVRNVVGADPNTGAVAIGDFVRPGQTVQFHLRDEQSADEDLRQLLAGAKSATTSTTHSAAALVFTCNGRGTRLFSSPDHDATCVRQVLGEIPTAGFFAQGEIGPVGGANYLHGFTASVAIFGE